MGVGLTLAVLGLTQVKAAIPAQVAAQTARIGAEIQYAGLACQRYAKIACPVDTGRLRSSIAYRRQDAFSSIVGTNVVYAPFVELGHRTRGGGGYVAPRPFLTPAYEQAKRELLTALRAL